MKQNSLRLKRISLASIVIIILNLVITMMESGCNSPEVDFQDINLVAEIRETIGKSTGPIRVWDLEQITSLDAGYARISDISGLELCINLTELRLSRNRITDISPLLSLKHLTYIDLDGNPISDISPLSCLINLKALRMSWSFFETPYVNTPFSYIANGTPIFGPLTDLSPLSSLTRLEVLDLGWNQISDLSPLSSLNNLRPSSASGEIRCNAQILAWTSMTDRISVISRIRSTVRGLTTK